MALNGDQLAQYRGCWPDNPCYGDCVEVARYSIEEQTDPDELCRAEEWAAGQTWV